MRLNFPVLQPLSFVKESVNNLDYRLSMPQVMNLMLLVTAIISSNSLCLSTISLTLMKKRSVNTLSHFFSYSGIDAKQIMSSAIRWAIHKMNLSGASVRLAVDDTMKHHSKGAKKNCKCLLAI